MNGKLLFARSPVKQWSSMVLPRPPLIDALSPLLSPLLRLARDPSRHRYRWL